MLREERRQVEPHTAPLVHENFPANDGVCRPDAVAKQQAGDGIVRCPGVPQVIDRKRRTIALESRCQLPQVTVTTEDARPAPRRHPEYVPHSAALCPVGQALQKQGLARFRKQVATVVGR